MKNILSFPFNSKLVFRIFENLLNGSSGGYILSFHDLSPEVFISQVESLHPSKPIPLNELISRYKLGKSIKNCFAITFDDGVKTTVKKNWEVCLEKKWPVTFYLPTDYVNGNNLPFQKIQLLNNFLEDKDFKLPKKKGDGKEKIVSKKQIIKYLRNIIYFESYQNVKNYLDYFLNFLPHKSELQNYDVIMPRAISWDEIQDISKNQLSSFQSHGVTHTACSGLSKNELVAEMTKSKEIIENCTGKLVNSFCYPYGSPKSINNLSVEVASRYFEHSTTLIKGRLTNNCKLHYLPRIDLYQENKSSLARMKVALS